MSQTGLYGQLRLNPVRRVQPQRRRSRRHQRHRSAPSARGVPVRPTSGRRPTPRSRRPTARPSRRRRCSSCSAPAPSAAATATSSRNTAAATKWAWSRDLRPQGEGGHHLLLQHLLEPHPVPAALHPAAERGQRAERRLRGLRADQPGEVVRPLLRLHPHRSRATSAPTSRWCAVRRTCSTSAPRCGRGRTPCSASACCRSAAATDLNAITGAIDERRRPTRCCASRPSTTSSRPSSSLPAPRTSLNQVYEEPEGFQAPILQAFFGVKAQF